MTTATTKGERTRQALLDAAIARFGRDGYRRTSIADITRDAGLSGTASYAYFANKEELFIAAADADAGPVIEEGLAALTGDVSIDHWRGSLIVGLLEGLERHPLARRIVAGLEPEFTVRLLSIPALDKLRAENARRLRELQRAGEIRADIDPEQIARGMVPVVMSLLMALLQTGAEPAEFLGPDVAAIFDAAVLPPQP
ncbi:TetR/AcrR family transcriptional regulator [Actinomadura barringtoniae]|uniref:TetR/AcrR family transcriptional regulator n=1 Tax=Actinomadura barringtoniae TaxID=1427535 RepID=A0A939T9Z5_9ACTN|nr:TetR/AcrR family transcriptional regulator [Actinomadura barringtoniae]MBO2448510.1 TetR/AcrR family transcriptional regulator [Actinomadura barringtoniae]